MYNFCYIFKNSGSTFEIDNSIKLVRKFYPESNITVIGDFVKGADKYIKYHQNQHANRTHRVCEMLLMLAEKYDSFVLMYDDIFITRRVEFPYYGKGLISSNSSVSGYNACKSNTKDALLYFGKPTINFECHNPFIFESKKLKDLYKNINISINHLPKSLYANYYNIEPLTINDLKSNEMFKIKDNIAKHGVFSTCDNLTFGIQKIIKDLQN